MAQAPGLVAPTPREGNGPAHEVTAATNCAYTALPYPCQDFTEQFQVLLPKDVQPCREAIAALLGKLQVDGRNYQIGKTKVSTATLAAAIPHPLHPRVTSHFSQYPTLL